MESQFIRINKGCREINGFGKNADINQPITKYLRLWANFYGLD